MHRKEAGFFVDWIFRREAYKDFSRNIFNYILSNFSMERTVGFRLSQN